MNESVIETRQVTKSYGSLQALNQVSIHVKQGEIYGLIGDNGAGKTTLLKALAGLIWPDSGEIRLFGQHGEKRLEQCRRQMGTMIESSGFFPSLTVETNLEYYRILKGIPGRKKTAEILRLTGMWEHRKKKGRELSMGMKQRLGLAIAMIGEPRLLLLDEPINGLDPSGMIAFRNLLRRLNEERNITILLSSHILSELQLTADTFGFLSKGQLIEEISARDLEEKCADSLLITVSDPDRYAAALDHAFPDERWRVLPDKVIQLFHPEHSPEEYSRLAAEHQILVTGLEHRRHSLEDYYLSTPPPHFPTPGWWPTPSCSARRPWWLPLSSTMNTEKTGA